MDGEYATAHQWYGTILSILGRHEQALAELKKAHECDPLAIQINNTYAHSLSLNGRNEEALEQLRKSREMDKDFCGTAVLTGQVYRSMGKLNEAISELQSPNALDLCSGGWGQSELAYTYGLAGNRPEAERLIQELKELSLHRYISTGYIAVPYLGIGDNEQALFWLEKGYNDATLSIADLEVHIPALRSDPRFADFLRRLNLQ